MDSIFEEWWSRTRRQIQGWDMRRFDAFVALIARILWKQRNARVFGNIQQQWGMGRIVDSIKEEFKMWEISYAGGSSTLARD
jgi:hypothetical protein